MVCYPEVQKKAQEELDKVLNGRLPEHSDIMSLPYLSALVKEVYRYGEVGFDYSLPQTHTRHTSVSSRWQPVLPLGKPLCSNNTYCIECPYLVKEVRICRLATISTTAIIFLRTLL